MIKNGKDTPLNESFGNLPNMASTLDGWLMTLVFIKTIKTIINYNAVETEEEFSFQGVWQPLSLSELKMKPENERTWKWYNCHTKTDLGLKNDDIITYKDIKYRVMSTGYFEDYGYYNYHLVEDYQ